MRWYLTHLKVLHLCWFNKRNNKRVLFVDDCDTLISQSVLISQFIKVNWPLSHEKINTKGFQALPKKQFFSVACPGKVKQKNLNLNCESESGHSESTVLNHLDQPFLSQKQLLHRTEARWH
jgi:hypothetical protein